ncbi:hypothetical protein [Streptomyces aureus]|uniref:hypothetical protein n=1 Tax=Streptomyces aureus TaxID=193461 RepID=UPI000A9EB3C8|nr:hypothetical protein [Streptomyces aureus]
MSKATLTDVFQDRRNYVWDNRSDTATLRDDRNRVVETESGATATTAADPNRRGPVFHAHSGRRGTGTSSSDTAEACGRGLVMIGRPRTASALRGHGRGGQPERIW